MSLSRYRRQDVLTDRRAGQGVGVAGDTGEPVLVRAHVERFVPPLHGQPESFGPHAGAVLGAAVTADAAVGRQAGSTVRRSDLGRPGGVNSEDLDAAIQRIDDRDPPVGV